MEKSANRMVKVSYKEVKQIKRKEKHPNNVEPVIMNAKKKTRNQTHP